VAEKNKIAIDSEHAVAIPHLTPAAVNNLVWRHRLSRVKRGREWELHSRNVVVCKRYMQEQAIA